MDSPDAQIDEDFKLALELSLADDAVDDDASVALAMQLQLEEERRPPPARRKQQASIHDKIQVISRDDFPALSSHIRDDDDEDAEKGDGLNILSTEGIVVDPKAGNGLIGRREDGSLVSKHDPAIDARLKALALRDNFDGAAGDLSDDVKVSGRVYNDLVRKQQRNQA